MRVNIHIRSFACGYPLVPVPLDERTTLSLLNCFGVFVDVFFFFHHTQKDAHYMCCSAPVGVFCLFKGIIFPRNYCMSLYQDFPHSLFYFILLNHKNIDVYKFFLWYMLLKQFLECLWSPFLFFLNSCAFVCFICILQSSKYFPMWSFLEVLYFSPKFYLLIFSFIILKIFPIYV